MERRLGEGICERMWETGSYSENLGSRWEVPFGLGRKTVIDHHEQ